MLRIRYLAACAACLAMACVVLPRAARGERPPAVTTTEQPKPAPPAAGAGDLKYAPEQIRDTSADVFLERMLHAEAGYHKFAALWALTQKVKESAAREQRWMVSMVIAAMKDTKRPVYQRWQCCYVLSGSGAEQGVPDLIDVLLHDDSDIVRSVAAEALAGFAQSAAAHDAPLRAAREEASPRVRDVLARHLGKEMPAKEPRSAPEAVSRSRSTSPTRAEFGSVTYTPEQIRDTSAEIFLERMNKAEPGYHPFAAMRALTAKAKEGSAAARRRVVALVTGAMYDTRRPVYQRYQCCYVLSDSGTKQAVPDLAQVLLHDESSTMRGVAAEALGKFDRNAAARDALLQAARQETDPSVRETLSRHLGEAMPTVRPTPTAPETPRGPALPVAEPLPWPFPGGQEYQHIFNSCQQATDIYVHSGLDFLHPAGTPVTAVDSGYVAAISTNYPDWLTHYFFIVTPERGGNEGWCYTHLDPRTFTFGEGDFIRQGQRLGTLVDLSAGDQPSISHLHLHYVRFSRDASRKVKVHSLLDPLYFFDWTDAEPPDLPASALRAGRHGRAVSGRCRGRRNGEWQGRHAGGRDRQHVRRSYGRPGGARGDALHQRRAGHRLRVRRADRW